MKILKPGSLFGLLGIIIFIYGLLFESIVEINIHDTYFITSGMWICTVFAMVLWIITGIYFVFERWKKPLRTGLGFSHFALTLIMFIANLYISLTASDTHYENMSEEMEHYGNVNALISLFVLIGLIGQLLFLINISLSVFRKRS